MKYFTILSMFVFSFILASCTQTENTFSPVAPVMNKTVIMPGNVTDNKYPFDLYTTFKFYDLNNWSLMDGNSVNVELADPLPDNCYSFAVTTYYSTGTQRNTSKVLTYLGLKSGTNIVVPIISGQKLTDVKIYGSSIATGRNIDIYPDGQNFSSIKVDGYKVVNKTIDITAAGYATHFTQVYTIIHYNGNSVLMFLQKPTSNIFSIPCFGTSDVTGVTLYGLTNLISTK
jgi:hypothetical protein